MLGLVREHVFKAFPFWTVFHFFPTNRKLKKGDPVILDVAPIVNGYIADIGYAFSFGKDTTTHRKMRKDLMKYRKFILDKVNRNENFKQIYKDLNNLFIQDSYTNVHSKYPQGVLGHRVAMIKDKKPSRCHLFGFGLDQYLWLISRSILGKLLPFLFRSPLWNNHYESNHEPYSGLWAVEPHIGFEQYGVKWEEILVINQGASSNKAYWLDEQLPHVQEAKKQGW